MLINNMIENKWLCDQCGTVFIKDSVYLSLVKKRTLCNACSLRDEIKELETFNKMEIRVATLEKQMRTIYKAFWFLSIYAIYYFVF